MVLPLGDDKRPKQLLIIFLGYHVTNKRLCSLVLIPPREGPWNNLVGWESGGLSKRGFWCCRFVCKIIIFQCVLYIQLHVSTRCRCRLAAPLYANMRSFCVILSLPTFFWYFQYDVCGVVLWNTLRSLYLQWSGSAHGTCSASRATQN